MADRLPSMVETAGPIAAGFSACVDLVVTFGSPEYECVLAGLLSEDVAIQELSRWLLERIHQGRGGEIEAESAAFRWLEQSVHGTAELGGTGAQVAKVLASIGASQILALSDRSAMQMAVLNPRVELAGSRSTSEIVGNPPILVLEFSQGTRLNAVRSVERSTRIIVRSPDRRLDLDCDFSAVVRQRSITTLLLSGFQTAPRAALPSIHAWFDAEFGWLKAAERVVHFELAEYESAQHAFDVISGFTGLVNSLGMSLSELRMLEPSLEPVDAAASLAERFAFTRVAVHADDFAFAVSLRPIGDESDALMTGCLLAASRATSGTLALPSGLPQNTTLTLPGGVAEVSTHQNGYGVTNVPSPHTPHPKTTLGLGDTFVAGMLLSLTHQMANADTTRMETA
ncbi:ADP-dependent glucokinase/phosphofructokinase [Herbiconiux sp. UC225_62]|uniref:ADP-dependent glucokinase/phosphofructokinase n=1 Tax=Herbiconiux sp. UC225_62 TaxID=3350168 RepID=UPI0036D31C13